MRLAGLIPMIRASEQATIPKVIQALLCGCMRLRRASMYQQRWGQGTGIQVTTQAKRFLRVERWKETAVAEETIALLCVPMPSPLEDLSSVASRSPHTSKIQLKQSEASLFAHCGSSSHYVLHCIVHSCLNRRERLSFLGGSLAAHCCVLPPHCSTTDELN
jgi:hypothetical protein